MSDEVSLKYLGCDPEVFLKNSRGTYVSAHGLLPGTKDKPHPTTNGTVQVDGMAAEVGIEPAGTLTEWMSGVQGVMGDLAAMLTDHTVSIVPSVKFSKVEFDKAPKEAKELGCDPDFDAYTGDTNESPDGAARMRTGAGHIHLGWCNGVDIDDDNHVESCMILVRELDFWVGLPLAFLERGDKAASDRRKMYGSPGAFRPKSYGVEYRSPSNYWLSDPAIMAWVYKQCHAVFEMLIKGEFKHQKLSGTVTKEFSGKATGTQSFKGLNTAMDLVRNKDFNKLIRDKMERIEGSERGRIIKELTETFFLTHKDAEEEYNRNFRG